MRIADLGFATGITRRIPGLRDALALPGFPPIATASVIAQRLRALADLGDALTPSGERQAMLALGLFVFGLDTLAYQELERRTDWRHGAAERFGARPASQFLGPGGDLVTLPGILLPELVGDMGAIDRLREMGDTGEAWPLVESGGAIIGSFVIRAIDEKRSFFLPGGIPRKIDFAVDLERVA